MESKNSPEIAEQELLPVDVISILRQVIVSQQTSASFCQVPRWLTCADNALRDTPSPHWMRTQATRPSLTPWYMDCLDPSLPWSASAPSRTFHGFMPPLFQPPKSI
ncbi:hypothetical protein BDN72DRAFT_836362 [Pluteus cervinus]|uniref:Uncharacterized protein n=1 Tax=Pluteus cervinus TaxID=181527 RepID=A0ACD3B420_9AGAR|nr:hypothetical protein BDN72DRAFT_836362 [Pluteus cervinus]